MSPKGQVYLFAILFILVGSGFTLYKVIVLDFPLFPDETRRVWSIEAKVEFEATGKPITANLALPESQPNLTILDEFFASSGYGFALEGDPKQRRAEWTRREVTGPQVLYYRLQITDDAKPPLSADTREPPEVSPPSWGSGEAAVARGLLKTARELSSDTRSFTRQLLQLMRGPTVSQDAELLYRISGLSAPELTLQLLAEENIPARLIRGVQLQNRLYNQRPVELIEVFDGERWLPFDPRTASPGIPENFFMWQRGGRSLLDVVGGENSRVLFSVLGNDVPAKTVALQQSKDETEALVDFNIYSLPIDKQTIFKSLLLVPIGALVVVFFRVLVGINTAGTFMPVLLALAFVQTTLAAGLFILLALMTAGLWIRSYLSRLDLLMVARLAAVLIVVVLLMAGFSVFSYKLGLDQMLTITFFPMIIIAWTIERMSVVWEEDGPREVFIQGAGTLVVAIVAYLAMTTRVLEHLTYNFPETLLVVLGIILILGQYTGYRLTELRRFRFLIDK